MPCSSQDPLFKSAIIDSEHLKSLDVICLDGLQKSIENRYNSFVDFKNYRYISRDILEYLELIYEKSKKLIPSNSGTNLVKFNGIEKAHDEFFKKDVNT